MIDIAKLFLEPAFRAIIALIQGKTSDEAYRESQKLYVDNLQLCLASNSTNFNTAIASRLYHDFQYQVCLGDPSSSF